MKFLISRELKKFTKFTKTVMQQGRQGFMIPIEYTFFSKPFMSQKKRQH